MRKIKRLTKKDVCIITPTYNRASDIDRTLSFILEKRNIPGRIIIVDQSKNDETKKIIKKYEKKLPIKYIYSHVASSSISVNLALKEGALEYPLIITLGDDVDLFNNYLNEIIEEFNNHSEVKAVGGVESKSVEQYNFKEFKNKLSNIVLKIFFLPFKENHKFRVTGPYGHTSSPKIKEKIRDAQWLPGFNACFRKEIFEDYRMPNIRGYNVLEDIDISYSTYQKYGKGSLVITPKAKVHHRWSPKARYAEKKRIFVNHEDHFSFYYRHFNNLSGATKLIISLSGIIAGSLVKFLVKPGEKSFQVFKNNLNGILYAYRNRRNIRKGRFRMFLNEDLSMKF